jgi:hypothetical protein
LLGSGNGWLFSSLHLWRIMDVNLLSIVLLWCLCLLMRP